MFIAGEPAIAFMEPIVFIFIVFIVDIVFILPMLWFIVGTEYEFIELILPGIVELYCT